MSKSQIESLNKVDYSTPKLGFLKWILFFFGIILLGVVLHFPLKSYISKKLVTLAYQNPSCPITIDDVQFELFMPKVIIPNASIPSRCHKAGPKDLKLKNTRLNFRGLSFSPLGPHFKLSSNVANNQINALLSIGLNEQRINISDNNIKLDKLKEDIPKIKLSGNLNLNASILLKEQQIDDLKLNIISRNFKLDSQTISSFKLKAMQLNTLQLKAESISPKKLKVHTLTLGDNKADIRANFAGHVKMNSKSFQSSILDLNGDLAFSESFLTDYAIIKMLMAKFDRRDKFYQLKIKGPMYSPQFK